MNLRLVIILILSGFGVAPLALLISINFPSVLARLDLAAQQESISRLQSEQYGLNVRVERLKERVSSLASLPGAKDIIGHQESLGIDREKAVKRLSGLIEKWFGSHREILNVRLIDIHGKEHLHLTRNGSGSLRQVGNGINHQHVASEFCMTGLKVPFGSVKVSDIDLNPRPAGHNISQAYGISLVTPVVAAKGKIIGVLCFRVNMTDFLRDYAESLWLDREGNSLRRIQEAVLGKDRDDSEGFGVAETEEFPGLKSLLVANQAVVWSGEGGRKVAWQPIIFNEHMAATLWVGHDVDRGDLERWLEKRQKHMAVIFLVLVLGVIFLAGRVASFIDRRKVELVEGFDAILTGSKPRPFGWSYLREMRQMADELNILAERYFDMRLARQRAEDELRESNARLEEIVERRTAELFATNEQLSEEVEERSRAEEEMIKYREHLEEMVQQRLVELAETNEQLQLEMVRRKHAQDSMRKNEARLRVILDSVPIGIFIVDREKQTITYANPAAAGMIGADSPSVLNGSQCHSFFCEGDKGQQRCIGMNDRFEQADVTLQRLDGSPLSVLKTVIPLTLADRPCLLESITDITELKLMATQNEALQEQLLQSQKMEAVGVLAGGIAHDFNNLLTIIQGSADLAMLSSSVEQKEHRYLGQIKETTERAGNLVRQLLLFSRTQPMTLSILRLNDVVENLLKMLKRLIGEDIEIITDLSTDLVLVEGNAANVEQVIMNLAVNGRDAMDNGGKLYIRSCNVEFDEKTAATMSDARPGCFACLEVTDSGGGIDEETLQHIFEPFFTTKEAGKGTGLGLAVVYGIVKQHQGWIDVVGVEGQGTSFKIYLPASVGESVDEVIESTELHLQGEGQRVLVVEDDETLRRLIADTLERKGFKVLQAVDAVQALDIFQQENGAFDLLFSDVVMPGEHNGIQLADLIREKRPEMPVILSSGYTDQKSQWAIIEERGFAFLQKPFNIVTLVRMVCETMQGNGRAGE